MVKTFKNNETKTNQIIAYAINSVTKSRENVEREITHCLNLKDFREQSLGR